MRRVIGIVSIGLLWLSNLVAAESAANPGEDEMLQRSFEMTRNVERYSGGVIEIQEGIVLEIDNGKRTLTTTSFQARVPLNAEVWVGESQSALSLLQRNDPISAILIVLPDGSTEALFVWENPDVVLM